jgi:hypothetical protein
MCFMFFLAHQNQNISRLKVLRDPGFDGLQRIIQVFAQFQLQLIHTFFQVQRHPIAFLASMGGFLGPCLGMVPRNGGKR